MLRSHHLGLYIIITDNKLVVFLTSLHCTFMLRTLRGWLNSKLYVYVIILYSVYSVSCCPHADQRLPKFPTTHQKIRPVFLYVLLVSLSYVLPYLDLCVTVVTGTLCFNSLKVIVNLLQRSSPGVPWGLE